MTELEPLSCLFSESQTLQGPCSFLTQSLPMFCSLTPEISTPPHMNDKFLPFHFLKEASTNLPGSSALCPQYTPLSSFIQYLSRSVTKYTMKVEVMSLLFFAQYCYSLCNTILVCCVSDDIKLRLYTYTCMCIYTHTD